MQTCVIHRMHREKRGSQFAVRPPPSYLPCFRWWENPACRSSRICNVIPISRGPRSPELLCPSRGFWELKPTRGGPRHSEKLPRPAEVWLITSHGGAPFQTLTDGPTQWCVLQKLRELNSVKSANDFISFNEDIWTQKHKSEWEKFSMPSRTLMDLSFLAENNQKTQTYLRGFIIISSILHRH